jgi:hypothetical protein
MFNEEINMLHYWSETKPPAPSPPARMLLDLDNYRLKIADLEHEIGASINQDELLSQLMDSLQYDATAEIEVEYLYLDLVDKHCYGALYYEFERVLEFMMHLSKELLDTLRYNRLYSSGELLYAYQGMHADGVLLQRKDLHHAQLNQELSDVNCFPSAGLHYPRHARMLACL